MERHRLTMDEEQFLSTLLRETESIAVRMRGQYTDRPTAVFDLDNTLLIGDIGEAVLATLLLAGHKCALTWSEYKLLLAHNRPEAYLQAALALEGASETTVKEIARSLLLTTRETITVDDDDVAIPRPHPVMKAFLQELSEWGFRLLVVSASNSISVRVTAHDCFGISPKNAIGITSQIENGIVTPKVSPPIPIWHGKVDAVKKVLGTTQPLITCGDSALDLPMMQMCDPRGFSVWVGEDESNWTNVRSQFLKKSSLLFVPRHSLLQCQQEPVQAG